MTRLLQRLAARANDTAVLLRPDPRPVAGISAPGRDISVAPMQPGVDDGGTLVPAPRVAAAVTLPDVDTAPTHARAPNGFLDAPPRVGLPDRRSLHPSGSVRVPQPLQTRSGHGPQVDATASAPVPARPTVPEQSASTPSAARRARARPAQEAAAAGAPASAARPEAAAQQTQRPLPHVERMPGSPASPASATHRTPTAESEQRFPTMLLSPAPAPSSAARLGSGARPDATELHIHIGRIDVTAVREPAAARRRPAPAQAPTSLDAYLAQRRRS